MAKTLRYRPCSVFCSFMLAIFYLSGCIPIEDKINPDTFPFEIQETYYYQDTIDFTVAFFDNVLLDSATLTIEKAPDAEITAEDWFFTIDTLKLNGRRIEKSFEIPVPAFVKTGSYQLTVTGFDADGNPGMQTSLFQIGDDITPPVFEDVALELQIDDEVDYLSCRSEVIRVQGVVSDNIRLSRIGFSFNGSPDNLILVSADSLCLDDVFSTQLRVPFDIEDGDVLDLSLVAIDTFGNRSAESFSILIDCDDEPPVISFLETSPALSNNNEVIVSQGGVFQIINVEISDNRALQKAEVYFNLLGEPPNLLHEVDLTGSGPLNLSAFVDLGFVVEENAIVGEVREYSFLAYDTAGNISPIETLRLTVIEDLPPRILITNTYINDEAQSWDRLGLTSIGLGDFITIDGKIEEDNELNGLEISWSVLGQGQPIALVREGSFESLPVELSSYFPPGRFSVPEDLTVGVQLELVILAVDSKQQQDRIEFRFVVVD